MQDRFREICKLMSKITLKIIKVKKTKRHTPDFFSNFDENHLLSKKQISKKALFVI